MFSGCFTRETAGMTMEAATTMRISTDALTRIRLSTLILLNIRIGVIVDGRWGIPNGHLSRDRYPAIAAQYTIGSTV